jgi:hypothetical protein
MTMTTLSSSVRCSLALAAALAGCATTVQPSATVRCQPLGETVLALPNGRVYRGTAIGQVVMVSGGGASVHGGSAVAWVPEGANDQQITAAARELFDALQPEAQGLRMSALAVLAYAPGETKPRRYLWRRDGPSTWSLVAPTSPAGELRVANSACDQRQVADRDEPWFESAASAEPAVDAARSWLAMLDRGEFAEARGRAHDILRSRSSAEEWLTEVSAGRGMRGAITERREVYRLLVAAPHGRLSRQVSFVYLSRFANGTAAVESLAAAEDGGHWSVTGYGISEG